MRLTKLKMKTTSKKKKNEDELKKKKKKKTTLTKIGCDIIVNYTC